MHQLYCAALAYINKYHFRTARGDNTGSALSLVTASDDKTINDVQERLQPSSGKRSIFYPFDCTTGDKNFQC